MANKNAVDAGEMSELHKLLGMTPAQARQELIDQGLDPETEVAAMRRLGQVLAAKFSPQIEREGLMGLLDVIAETTPEDAIWARVAGWSMGDEGINASDMVLFNSNAEARDGNLVLAHPEGQGQMMSMRMLRNKVVLESANPDFAPIVVEDPAILLIHGVVVGRVGKV